MVIRNMIIRIKKKKIRRTCIFQNGFAEKWDDKRREILYYSFFIFGIIFYYSSNSELSEFRVYSIYLVYLETIDFISG